MIYAMIKNIKKHTSPQLVHRHLKQLLVKLLHICIWNSKFAMWRKNSDLDQNYESFIFLLDCERSLLSTDLVSRACKGKGRTADNTSRNETRQLFALVKLAPPLHKHYLCLIKLVGNEPKGLPTNFPKWREQQIKLYLINISFYQNNIDRFSYLKYT